MSWGVERVVHRQSLNDRAHLTHGHIATCTDIEGLTFRTVNWST